MLRIYAQWESSKASFCGYLPPEYIRFGKITKKNDIFSLGVVMIKIIAGPRGRKRSAEMPPQEFIDQVQGNWRKRLQCTWSGSLLEAYCQQVKTCTEIALNCMEEDRHTRPGIAAIILSLNEMETMIEELKNDAESGLDEVHVTTTAPVEEAPVVVAAVQPTAVVVVETPKEEAGRCFSRP
ncbi:cysteine-rich receptor-like protein kinase 43 isoform X5 [Miscanthus floridulus]|uniref:cysteine-rich receptor-like protein kinase 43 isoform X5 n=1 Tax=Miscanthus floridulus TaxID=154761 RepID=UPI0034581007